MLVCSSLYIFLLNIHYFLRSDFVVFFKWASFHRSSALLFTFCRPAWPSSATSVFPFFPPNLMPFVSVTISNPFRMHYGPGLDSACNRNEHQEYFLLRKGGRCVGLTTLPPSCADCLEIWEPQPPGTLRACRCLS
jgi:hypothetical protein